MAKLHAIRTNSKIFLIGDKGRQEMMDLRSSGRTYQEITNFLNEHYKHVLNANSKFDIMGVYNFFKLRGKEQLAIMNETKLNTIKKRLSNSNDIVELTETMNTWLKEYKDAGEKLSLKDTINSYIKLYELRIKIDEMEQKSKSNETSGVVKDFISKVQQEFGNPKVTQELKESYNQDGTVKARESKIEYSNNTNSNESNKEPKQVDIIIEQEDK